jgi:hypothetical protein
MAQDIGARWREENDMTAETLGDRRSLVVVGRTKPAAAHTLHTPSCAMSIRVGGRKSFLESICFFFLQGRNPFVWRSEIGGEDKSISNRRCILPRRGINRRFSTREVCFRGFSNALN